MNRVAFCVCLISVCSTGLAATGQEPLSILEDTTVIGIPYEPPVTQTRLRQSCEGGPNIRSNGRVPERWDLRFKTVAGDTHFGYGRPSREAAYAEWYDFCAPTARHF